jgi:riboflavin biosynthesis pyrimidine reductase/pyrimidine deaminase RibD-like protein
MLSSAADADRVDGVRAGVDAILVGAGTIRSDNPRLLVRSRARREARAARGQPPSPAKVTLTATGNLDPAARFFTDGDGDKFVYCASGAFAAATARLGHAGLVTVIDAGARPTPREILGDLAGRGIERLMVEGGAAVLRQFLAAGLANELQLVVAPFFVGDPSAPHFAGPATYPHDAGNPMTLAQVRRLGDVVLLRYLLGPSGADQRWLRMAIELSRRCPPSARAYSVGAVIVGGDGDLVATGFSRECDASDHAEEVALRKAAARPRRAPTLAGATLYSSLEPCSVRASRPRTCTELIMAAGIGRVVFAWREPPLFADCQGAQILRAAGVTVTEVPELADQVYAVNAHLFRG